MKKIKLNLEEIGNRLKAARKAVAITQQVAADMSGIPKSTVSEMENGLKRPQAKYLLLLASQFKVNLNWIFTGKGSMFDYEISWDFGKENETFKDMLYLIENSPNFRLTIFKYFVDLIKDNEDIRKVLSEKGSEGDIP